MNEQSLIPESYVFITLLLALVGDLVFRLAWNKIYFTFGIPIFVMSFPVKTRYKGVPFKYLLEEKFKGRWLWRSILFQQLDTRKIGFREQFLEIHYSYLPLMHGLLVFENDKKRVVVKGLSNWFTLWLIISLTLEKLNMINFFQSHVTNSITFIVLVFAFFYVLQCFQFLKVCKSAAEMCSIKSFLDKDGV